jgi:hypothetical protein
MWDKRRAATGTSNDLWHLCIHCSTCSTLVVVRSRPVAPQSLILITESFQQPVAFDLTLYSIYYHIAVSRQQNQTIPGLEQGS